MKVAKADNNDFESTRIFFLSAEMALDSHSYSLRDPADNWEGLDPEDEERQLIEKIKQELVDDEGDRIDNRILMYEYLKRKFESASASWRRVYYAGTILIDNCCDPQEDHLSFSPYLVHQPTDREM